MKILASEHPQERNHQRVWAQVESDHCFRKLKQRDRGFRNLLAGFDELCRSHGESEISAARKKVFLLTTSILAAIAYYYGEAQQQEAKQKGLKTNAYSKDRTKTLAALRTVRAYLDEGLQLTSSR